MLGNNTPVHACLSGFLQMQVETCMSAYGLACVQATVGTLVAKTLTSSTSNPYAAAGQAARTTTPTALDAFSVQASPALYAALHIESYPSKDRKRTSRGTGASSFHLHVRSFVTASGL